MRKPISEMTDEEYFQHRVTASLNRSKICQELTEIFGDPTNVAPTGTGAVLTTPSVLSLDIVAQLAREMPMDEVLYQAGKLLARQLADQLERQGLKASDYALVPELPKIVAKRMTGRIHSSAQFARGVVEGLMQRG